MVRATGQRGIPQANDSVCRGVAICLSVFCFCNHEREQIPTMKSLYLLTYCREQMGLFLPMTNVVEVTHWYSLFCSQPCYQALIFLPQTLDHLIFFFRRPTAVFVLFLLSAHFAAVEPHRKFVQHKINTVSPAHQK